MLSGLFDSKSHKRPSADIAKTSKKPKSMAEASAKATGAPSAPAGLLLKSVSQRLEVLMCSPGKTRFSKEPATSSLFHGVFFSHRELDLDSNSSDYGEMVVYSGSSSSSELTWRKRGLTVLLVPLDFQLARGLSQM